MDNILGLSGKYDFSFLKDEVVIGDDLSIKTYNNLLEFDRPTKVNNAVIIFCISGNATIKVNLQTYEIESPSMVTLMPGQIFEPMESSNNFCAHVITLSKRFIDMINLPGWQQRYLTLYNNPITEMEVEQSNAARFFLAILHRAASNVDNPFRLQVIENLVRVFYYGGINGNSPAKDNVSPYKNNIVERFLELVHTHYREERMISFYANKLCITPKYLSKIVKENTGRSAGEWIENHVVLDARAMLQSSDMTIQQIAVSLNFPNQSFFGKYFKRATGMSPKQYRNNGAM